MARRPPGFATKPVHWFPGWRTTGAQGVGSIGLKIDGGAATTLKFTIHAGPDLGPDLKVFGGAPVASAPDMRDFGP